jgi:coenzyme F420-0:L-glutamate ligase/coenzyme F420-1:gamma-L-glutamate ligase
MDLPQILLEALHRQECTRRNPILMVVAQKIVSKAEGRMVTLRDVIPSPRAEDWAKEYKKDARIIEVILGQSRRMIRMERGIIIAETHHGYICANAGVDASNAPEGTVILLPPDPDRSAEQIRARLEAALGATAAVIVSDTFGRPWRNGLTNVALGVAGLSAFIDYRGQTDSFGRLLQASVIAVADEIAAAAELVMGKVSGIPAAIVEGCNYIQAQGSGRSLIRSEEEDLFR